MQAIQRRLGRPPEPAGPAFDPADWRDLRHLAQQEDRRFEELAGEALSLGVARLQSDAELLRLWALFTPREQQVIALVCLGYTGRQAAARLGISHQTVKTHSANALRKLGLSNRAELRLFFAGWDFSAWENLE